MLGGRPAWTRLALAFHNLHGMIDHSLLSVPGGRMLRKVILAFAMLSVLAGCQTLTGAGEGPVYLTPSKLAVVQYAAEETGNMFVALPDEGPGFGAVQGILCLPPQNCGDGYEKAVISCEVRTGKDCSVFFGGEAVLWNIPSPRRKIPTPIDGHWRNLEFTMTGLDGPLVGEVDWRRAPGAGAFKFRSTHLTLHHCNGEIRHSDVMGWAFRFECLGGEAANGELVSTDGSELYGEAETNNGNRITLTIQ
jgi:hypothetical protein